MPVLRDHPRGCGEHYRFASNEHWFIGSSPRMRGALSLCIQRALVHRIIPADAGSTNINASLSLVAPDHPRGCGEHAECRACGSGLTGSSPRMRGAHLRPRLNDLGQGIIPADAGSTVRCIHHCGYR